LNFVSIKNLNRMKKITILLFGVIAYSIFLFVFLYAIGFVGNLYVPKTIDSGTASTLLSAILINTLLLSVFALQHSIMARPKFKELFASVFSQAAERSTYVLLSSLALALIFWQWQPITTIVWEAESSMIITLITGLYFLGWLIVVLSTFMISHFELFGLTQIIDNLKNRQTAHPKFHTNYLYKVVRHPIMLGFLIAFWAAPTMTVGHLYFTIVTTVYVFVAVKYLEEKDLKKIIGEKYEAYQQEVPMIIPFTKRRSKF
jgi:protein-S-isoprenylcysteine O-methyltransferase Ste14